MQNLLILLDSYHTDMRLKRLPIIFSLLICLFLTQSKLNAQSQILKFKHLSIAEGLPQSTVNCFKQDNKGFIWIGTNGGLSRYDGYEFKNYKNANAGTSRNTLSSNYVNTIEVVNDKYLLVGTNMGLDLMNLSNGKISLISGTDSLLIDKIKKDSKGNIWVGTSKGLMRYNPQSQKLALARLFGNQNEISYNEEVDVIEEDGQHFIWVGFRDRKLIRFDPITKKEIALPAALQTNQVYNESHIITIRKGINQDIWFGSIENGLILLTDNYTKCVNIDSRNKLNRPQLERIRDIFVNGNNREVWVATRNGLFILDSNYQHLTKYTSNKFDSYSLSNSSICSIIKDYSGNIWVGTYSGGINLLEKGNDNFNYLENLMSGGGLSNSVIEDVLEDKMGNLWIATGGSGLDYYNRKTEKFSYISTPSNLGIDAGFVESIAEDGDAVWLGTLYGLFSYDKSSKTLKQFILPQIAAFKGHTPAIFALEKSKKGGLWIGSQLGLFYKDQSGKISVYTHKDGDPTSLADDQITYLSEDKDGDLWIGRLNGLSLFSSKTGVFTNFNKQNAKVQINSVFSVKQDSRGIIWVGTHENGLVYYDKVHRTFGVIDNGFGLQDASVRGITEDNSGNLWVSCSNGISKIIFKKQRPPFGISDLNIVNYSVQNGLKSNEFLSTALRTKDGELIFAGMNGVVMFNPDKMFVNKFKPQVVITAFQIDNKDVESKINADSLNEAITYTSKIKLTYNQAYFTLKFAALNYVNSGSNQYAYKMEGLSGDQWHNIGTERSATYTNLAPGNYTFKVKAANNDGLWNDKITTLQIIILPPIWRTWYAYLFYILVVFCILFSFYYYSLKEDRLKNDLKLQRAINENEKEFTRQKINFFTNISHEIKTPLTLILAPLDKLISKIHDTHYPELSTMQRNGKKLIKLLDQLLSFRRFEAGAMVLQAQNSDIVAFTRTAVADFEDFAIKREIQLKFSSGLPLIPVWFDADKYEKIINNLLSNALKFTPIGGQVDVFLDIIQNDEANSLVELKVRDNGTGIAKDHLNKVFENFYHNEESGMPIEGAGIGLSYTKALVELHHGQIRVESLKSSDEVKGYTCFSVQLPLGDAHLSINEKLEHVSSISSIVSNDKPHIENFDQELSYRDDIATNELDNESANQPILLILEDNIELQSFIATHFQNIYKIYSASNGREGWTKAIEVLPDIIISDIMMPDLSGMEFCQLAKNDPRTSHIPVILLTALDTDRHKIEGFQTGADDYITKPFSLPVLEVRIENLLTSRRKLQEYFQKDIKLEPNLITISKRDEEFLEKVMAFIENNMMEPELNVEDLSKEVNMTRVTLYRKIKALTNLSALEFIRSVRLKKAGQLLQLNEHSVNEVCYMVGFSDVDYFRKCFKNQFDTTPKKYASRFIEPRGKSLG